eukprot:UN10077
MVFNYLVSDLFLKVDPTLISGETIICFNRVPLQYQTLIILGPFSIFST